MLKHVQRTVNDRLVATGKRGTFVGLIAAALFAVAGLVLLQLSSAAVGDVIAEAESGVIAGRAERLDSVAGASAGSVVRFGSGGPVSTETPQFSQQVIATGLNRPWDLKFLPGGELLFTQREGNLKVFKNGAVSQVAKVSDAKFFAERSEGGLTGMAVDPLFSQNRLIYLCYNGTAGDVRVVRYRLAGNLAGLESRQDLVTGIESNESGRHSGCRMDFGPDGYLWIGTGDSATGSQPQQPQSLNGKILRITRDGQAAPDNNGAGFDARIYSYGHRNTQGIAFFKSPKNGVLGVSSEHGSSVDDEVNELRKGNFGWAPSGPPYNESVPMTDISRFPSAIRPIWTSGNPTQAVSGMTIINGSQWKGWDGAIAMAIQKDQHLKILRLDAQNKVTKEEEVLQNTYNRLRTVVQGPDGSLYISTDIGSTDRIVRLTAQ